MSTESKLVCYQLGRHNFDELKVGGKCVRCGKTFESIQKEKDLEIKKLKIDEVDLSKKKKKRKVCKTNFRAASGSLSLFNYDGVSK